MTTTIITYEQLAKRLDALKLFNKAPELDPEIYEGLENGDLYEPIEDCEWFLNDSKPHKRWCCSVHMYEGDDDMLEGTTPPDRCEWSEGTQREIFQWFLIGPNDADYLKRISDELIFYSEVLDEYVWGVTHFGTPWEGVNLTVRE